MSGTSVISHGLANGDARGPESDQSGREVENASSALTGQIWGRERPRTFGPR